MKAIVLFFLIHVFKMMGGWGVLTAFMLKYFFKLVDIILIQADTDQAHVVTCIQNFPGLNLGWDNNCPD